VGRDVRAVARRLRLVHRFRQLYLQGGTIPGAK